MSLERFLWKSIPLPLSAIFLARTKKIGCFLGRSVFPSAGDHQPPVPGSRISLMHTSSNVFSSNQATIHDFPGSIAVWKDPGILQTFNSELHSVRLD